MPEPLDDFASHSLRRPAYSIFISTLARSLPLPQSLPPRVPAVSVFFSLSLRKTVIDLFNLFFQRNNYPLFGDDEVNEFDERKLRANNLLFSWLHFFGSFQIVAFYHGGGEEEEGSSETWTT